MAATARPASLIRAAATYRRCPETELMQAPKTPDTSCSPSRTPGRCWNEATGSGVLQRRAVADGGLPAGDLVDGVDGPAEALDGRLDGLEVDVLPLQGQLQVLDRLVQLDQ